ncbi:DUF983 domain-containing protein [Novosphingobium sp. M1R2S20]|uniref:DUF983 domain-containing protein n=1 Tax=Novosphingobium rhizovicinum TaxID=3228928 RepID=A0ABV3RD42_9SPHN
MASRTGNDRTTKRVPAPCSDQAGYGAAQRALPIAAPLLYAAAMTTLPSASPALPSSYWQAVQRGTLCKCPRCGAAPLFRKWLKSVDACASCGQNWSHHCADDFPAYIAILITGHVLAPLMIALPLDYDWSPLAVFALLIPLSVAMMLGMLQSAKGAVIATQWWHGLHGFVKERQPEAGPALRD